MNTNLTHALSLFMRIFVIVVGGYMLTGGLTALSGGVIILFGVSVADAMLSVSMASFIFYPFLLIWAFGRFHDTRWLIRFMISAVLFMVVAYLVNMVFSA